MATNARHTTYDNLVSIVKSIMNERDYEVNPDIDVTDLDDYIKDSIPQAVFLFANARGVKVFNPSSYDISLLYKKDVNGNVVYGSDNTTPVYEFPTIYGAIPIPDDYVNLITLKIPQWSDYVTNTLDYDSEEYKRQTNKYTAATKSRPLVFEIYDYAAKRAFLRMFPFDKKDAASNCIESLVYNASFKSGDTFKYPSTHVYTRALCYFTASLVYATFGEQSLSAAMERTAMNILGRDNASQELEQAQQAE